MAFNSYRLNQTYQVHDSPGEPFNIYMDPKYCHGGWASVPAFDDMIITMMIRFMNVGIKLTRFTGFADFMNNLMVNGDQGNAMIMQEVTNDFPSDLFDFMPTSSRPSMAILSRRVVHRRAKSFRQFIELFDYQIWQWLMITLMTLFVFTMISSSLTRTRPVKIFELFRPLLSHSYLRTSIMSKRKYIALSSKILLYLWLPICLVLSKSFSKLVPTVYTRPAYYTNLEVSSLYDLFDHDHIKVVYTTGHSHDLQLYAGLRSFPEIEPLDFKRFDLIGQMVDNGSAVVVTSPEWAPLLKQRYSWLGLSMLEITNSRTNTQFGFIISKHIKNKYVLDLIFRIVMETGVKIHHDQMTQLRRGQPINYYSYSWSRSKRVLVLGDLWPGLLPVYLCALSCHLMILAAELIIRLTKVDRLIMSLAMVRQIIIVCDDNRWSHKKTRPKKLERVHSQDYIHPNLWNEELCRRPNSV